MSAWSTEGRPAGARFLQGASSPGRPAAPQWSTADLGSGGQRGSGRPGAAGPRGTHQGGTERLCVSCSYAVSGHVRSVCGGSLYGIVRVLEHSDGPFCLVDTECITLEGNVSVGSRLEPRERCLWVCVAVT